VNDVKLILQLGYILSPRERLEGGFLLCGMALAALFEAVSIGLVIPFIAALKEPRLVLDAPLAQPLLSALGLRDPQTLLVALALGLVAAFVIKSTYLVLLYRWLFRYAFTMQVDLNRQLLAGCLSMPYPSHLERNSAELLRMTTQTIQRFTTGFLVSLLTVLGEALVMAALLALLLLASPTATLGAVLALAVPVAVIYRALRRRLAEAGNSVERSMSAMIQWAEQATSGIKEAIVTGGAQYFIDQHGHHARQFAKSMRSMMLLSNVPRFLMDTFAVIAMVAIALIIFVQGQDRQSLLPVLGLFAIAAMRLLPSMNRIASGLTQLRFHYVAVDELYNELRTTRAVLASQASRPSRSSPPRPFERALVLEEVSYRYAGAGKPAINGVSLTIPKGHWIGIIGPTGAGKTTLIDLLLGLFVPTAGRILIDGRDLQDDVPGWQGNIGYVPQDIYLLDDTIRRNVAFGLPDREIDDARVWQALRGAQIERLVQALPDGLNAKTGERGERLSGGERQRLGIARALYRDPQVLVVDEGTANLDDETEAAIVQTLAGLRGDKTIIVIAHRLSVIKDCDQVYLLKHGQVQPPGEFAGPHQAEIGFRQNVELT
jgi:ATP-binding cassette, subfamily B, bacterial PglK